MINIILCDDNTVLLERYTKILNNLAKKHNIMISLQYYESGEALLFNLTDNLNYADIIYLDIIMDNMNGIEVAKTLRTRGCNSEIIFLTSSEEYVFESFDSAPLHYIIKGGIKESENFERIFLRAIEIVQKKEKETFFCENKQEKRNIKLHEISHFEIYGRKVTVYFTDGEFEFYSTMDELQEKLQECNLFVRCHRSYIVNIKYIETFNSKQITLVTGDNIPIGTTYSQDVKAAFSNFLVGELK